MALGIGRSPAISAVKDDFTISDMTHNFLRQGFRALGDLSLLYSIIAFGKVPISCARLYCSRPRNARHGCQLGVADYQEAKLVEIRPRREKPLNMLN